MVDTIVETYKNEVCNLVESLNSDENVPKRRIMFVCTGNTCRSPMAAALYNEHYAGEGSIAFSAGLAADGAGISRNAVLALADIGIHSHKENDYLSHISHTVTEADVVEADLVVGITNRHAMSLLFAFPAAAGKITAMPQDIADPYGGDADAYRSCLVQIQNALETMFVQNHGNSCENSDMSKDD